MNRVATDFSLHSRVRIVAGGDLSTSPSIPDNPKSQGYSRQSPDKIRSCFKKNSRNGSKSAPEYIYIYTIVTSRYNIEKDVTSLHSCEEYIYTLNLMRDRMYINLIKSELTIDLRTRRKNKPSDRKNFFARVEGLLNPLPSFPARTNAPT